ncbi:MAG: hypothetical protein JRG73_06715 [Deltaproteobacteria bacterium]|nr:hypothetical protein [Deltaproteobacteria bacterium]MBW2306615.1 hypothetical protein [Deltaproteobacteria bacterium]
MTESVLLTHQVSRFTKILMDQIQIAALLFMATMYVIKIKSILKRPAAFERTPSRGNEKQAISYAYMTLAMPWEMESTKKHWWRYFEFAIYHLGAAVIISTTFIMPYLPGLIAGKGAVLFIQGSVLLALVCGISRFVRRVIRPEMRVISTPDDYFSIGVLNLWLITAFFAAPQTSEPALIGFFGMTTFFLIYVPFSKISHYIFWPFIRYYQGKHFGHRGVYPKKAVPTVPSA